MKVDAKNQSEAKPKAREPQRSGSTKLLIFGIVILHFASTQTLPENLSKHLGKKHQRQEPEGEEFHTLPTHRTQPL
jgi:hypothetical protein